MSAIHTEIINWIIAKKGFTSYLEIGIRRVEQNFQHIRCKFRVGVDPDPNAHASFMGTSDEWFADHDNPVKFDIIFIDGDHSAEQVKRDFENAIRCLNGNGIILIHDTDPKDEKFSLYPRTTQRRWNGDVYKFLPELSRHPVDWRTVREDENGLTVVKQVNGTPRPDPEVKTWDEFIQHRDELLHPCTLEEMKQWI